MDGGDDCATVWTYLKPLTCILQNVQGGNFYVMCILL